MKLNLRRCLLAAAMVGACLFLTACGAASTEFDETVIMKSLPESACTIRVDSEDRVLTPLSVTIDKVDEDEGIRIIQATLQMEDDYYRLTRSMKMNYDYTEKEGWRLGYFTDLSTPVCVASGCPYTQADADALLAEEALDTGARFKDTTQGSDGSYDFNYTVNRDEVNLTLTGTVTVNFALNRSPSGHYNWGHSIKEDGMNYDWHFLGHYKVSTVAGYYEVDFNSYDPAEETIEVVATRKDGKKYVYDNAQIVGYVNISPGEKPHGTRCIKVKVTWNGDPKLFFIYPDTILLEDNEVWDLDKLS